MSDYVVTSEVHSESGALAGISRLLGERVPESLLDVGCGAGTWMRAARAIGVTTIVGIDGQMHVDASVLGGELLTLDLSKPFDLGRKFETVICLEVAEHLNEDAAASLVASLCRHGDHILFSAACPGQHGQQHLNCQWPAYWQSLFNREGYACDDRLRWDIWDDGRIEPWYRQNLFIAQRSPDHAGTERRLAPAIHPEMTPFLLLLDRKEVEDGRLPVGWYLANFAAAVKARIARAWR